MTAHQDPRAYDESDRRDQTRTGHQDPTPDGPLDVEWTPGRVVAMVASTELVGAGWATAVASELARVWAAQRPGVVLVDTDLERPQLHHAARVDNSLGLAEVLRGEAPVGDATRVVEEDRLFCVPAGNASEQPDAAFVPGRWDRLCKAFSDAGVTVVAYVPVQAAWLDTVVDTATDVVILTEQNRRLQWPNRDGAPPLRAVLGPMLPKASPPEIPTAARTGPPDPLTAAGVQDATKAAPLGSGTAGVTTDSPPAGPRVERADARVRQGRRRKVATILVVAAAMMVWAISRPGGGPEATESAGPPAEDAGARAEVPPAPSTARPVSPTASFSVAVGSYVDGTRAEQEVSRLGTRFPEASWMVAPVEVAGTVYHRVVGGLLPDSAAATGMASELVQGGVSDWVIRRSGWVVELGVWDSPDEAERQRAEARAEGIPAYVSRFQQADGSVGYAVYAGAYSGEAEAEYLLDRARETGVEAHVVPRVGRPSS